MSSLLTVGLLFVTLSYYYDIPFQYYKIGEEIDSFNDVPVYYNGTSPSVHGKHYTADGYELGVKWQCVEFVRRYYLETYQHKMPSFEGNAVNYFDESVSDGGFNSSRDLIQFTNNGQRIPTIGDILVFKGKYGHVAIVTSANQVSLEVIQQNVNKRSRDEIVISKSNYGFEFESRAKILGWLRMRP